MDFLGLVSLVLRLKGSKSGERRSKSSSLTSSFGDDSVGFPPDAWFGAEKQIRLISRAYMLDHIRSFDQT